MYTERNIELLDLKRSVSFKEGYQVNAPFKLKNKNDIGTAGFASVVYVSSKRSFILLLHGWYLENAFRHVIPSSPVT